MSDYQPLHRYEHCNILHQFLRTTLILTPTLANTTPYRLLVLLHGPGNEVTSFHVEACKGPKCRQENNSYSESWSPPTALRDMMKLPERQKTLFETPELYSQNGGSHSEY